jgi:hypothetical protein
LIGYGLTKWVVLIFFVIFLSGHAIAQPQATLKNLPQSVPLNRLMNITLELTWSGEADLYDIPQPDFSELMEFDVVERSLHATRQGGENGLRYDFVLKPLKRGKYDISRLRVECFEKGQDIPIAISLPQTVVEVGAPELIPRRIKITAGLGTIVAAGAIAFLLVFRKRKRTLEMIKCEARTGEQTRMDLLAELNAARALRIEGEMGSFLGRLMELAESDTLREHAEKSDELHMLAESVKFGGHTLSPDELNWAENIIKNAIRSAFPAGNEEEN